MREAGPLRADELDGSSIGQPRTARVPLWLSLALCVFSLLLINRRLNRDARAQGVAMIDLRSFALTEADGRWIAQEWGEELGRLLAEAGRVSAKDRRLIVELSAMVEALPFVAEVGEPRVIWPDGLDLPMRLHTPVACIPVRGSSAFLPVSDTGVVLSGSRATPHAAYGASLPVIGPHGPALNRLRPGDVLQEPEHLEALAVAISMWNHLPISDVLSLGRILIDASAERAPDGFPGGVCIELEGRRRILFGRAPGSGHPGELPQRLKWRSVTEGLRDLQDGENWDVQDVRWDEAVAIRRGGPSAGESSSGG